MHTVPRARRARLARSLPRFALGLVAGMAVVATPATVSAHAELDTITPKDKATVTGSPTEIIATFTEELKPSGSNLRIKDFGGRVIVEGGVVGADGTSMTLAITTPLEPGAYTVEWTSTSADDNDLDHGLTTFTVAAAPSTPPSPSADASVPAPTDASLQPSVAPTDTPAPSPSATPAPAASATDMIFPIAAALLVLAVIGAWLLRGRSRARG